MPNHTSGSGVTSIALAILAAVVLLAYGFALIAYFQRSAMTSWKTRVLSLSAIITGVVHVFGIATRSEIAKVAVTGSTLLYGASLLVFALAVRALGKRRLHVAGSGEMPEWLVDEGIFQFVRHPFYLSYLLAWTAGVVAAPKLIVIAAAAVMALQYVAAARAEECKFASSQLAEAYQAYRSRAGMFWPI